MRLPKEGHLIVQKKTSASVSAPGQPAHRHCGTVDSVSGNGRTSFDAGHDHVMQFRQGAQGKTAVAIAQSSNGQRLNHEHWLEDAPCTGCNTCSGR